MMKGIRENVLYIDDYTIFSIDVGTYLHINTALYHTGLHVDGSFLIR